MHFVLCWHLDVYQCVAVFKSETQLLCEVYHTRVVCVDARYVPFRKHTLNAHRMKPALYQVLREIKEKTGNLCLEFPWTLTQSDTSHHLSTYHPPILTYQLPTNYY